MRRENEQDRKLAEVRQRTEELLKRLENGGCKEAQKRITRARVERAKQALQEGGAGRGNPGA